MTTEVVCVSRDTPYKELVRLLLDRQVSALPVVDDRRHVVGIVSEADLLLKEELPPETEEAPLLERKRQRIQRAKAHGVVAADVMTTPAASIGQHTSVAEAARRMHAKAVKRLPPVTPGCWPRPWAGPRRWPDAFETAGPAGVGPAVRVEAIAVGGQDLRVWPAPYGRYCSAIFTTWSCRTVIQNGGL